jgi:cellobiose phosphorylase
LRRVRIHNRSKTRRVIEFTSYAEIVLAPQAADLAQPAFSNLFVETELLPEFRAILATRRPQDDKQQLPCMCHLLNVYTDKPYTLSFETDRSLFVGRARTVASPLAMVTDGELSNTVGSVLDPIVAIRCKVTLEPNAFMTLDLFTGVAENREQCITLVKKYHDRNFAHRIFRLAWTHGQILLHQFNISETDAQLYGKLASAIIYASKTGRADSSIIASNRRGQSSLWGYSISGDLPIVLLHIEDAANFNIVQQLIQAQAYWRVKGLVVDLVILNEERSSYRQVLQDKILGFIAATSDHIGNIVVRVADQVPIEDRMLLQTVARVILSDKRGSLKEQLSRRSVQLTMVPELPFTKLKSKITPHTIEPFTLDSQFVNGIGGFNALGNEYIIHLREGKPTPAPWVNVLANPHFGTLISESGQGYTWGENAHEFRLTPWENDPLQDSAGEAYYIRDEETGLVWSPTPLPCRGKGDYQTRHGFGYSVFEHVEDNIHSEMWVYTALYASVKYVVLKIRNESMRPRQLSATGYVAWVLGDLRTKNAMHVVTELSPSGALLAKNYYNTEFPDRTAFFDAASNLSLNAHTVTGDRTEFIGRNGSLKNPSALKRTRLSGRVGAGFDPCGAIQLAFDLPIGQSFEMVFTLGVGRDAHDADDLVQRYHGILEAQDVLTAVRQYWKQKLSIVKITTPDPALNIMANGWLIYQLLSSRLWGRSGYYQSGGAFGFRDQLQDVMALTHIAPELLRAHLLLCAAHQFEAGDVQHWWHPPQNRGVRTRCSDDYLWLPFALCHYLETTGDITILDEKTPFLQGRLLNADEESYYELPMVGEETVSLYQHAVRAIMHGLKFGVHGLPLMGSGDWNDGMNFVGIEGKGESVWLGFFLYSILKQFIPVATQYGDTAFAQRCNAEMLQLQEHIESNAWDGQWYRRAYFDDGTPVGSENSSECKIDSIAQSWSVLSGAGSPARTKQALASLYKHLVNPEVELIKLLAPPFDTSKPSPGYIQGYVPGIRENGGQYTHAAVWATMAFSKLGEHQLAWQLFRMLNPINHGDSPSNIARYKIEPYVLAADIYGVEPHTGRGGWSWYTGAAGWLYRLITEVLLGVQLEQGNKLRLTPSLPDDWDTFSLDYKYNSAVYVITVTRADEYSIEVDGVEVSESVIALLDDGKSHEVHVKVGSKA